MNDPENPKNPFAVATREAALQEVEKSRAIAETQAAMVMAKQFPRDQIKALDRILNACTRPKLAEAALYTYSRGGTEITGPSIRLAEVLAQNWQNIHWGTRELEQRQGESTMEAFAWDLETNGKQIKAFQVKHERHSKQGGVTKLTDPRDIYETTANQGARRLRACILGVIPGDIIEEAVAQCELTLKSNSEVTPESLSKLLEVFEKYGVTKAQIEKRIQRHLDSMLPAQLAGLRKIYNSLKDGMSKPQDWFEDATEMPRFKSEKKAEPETEKRKVGRPKKRTREEMIADLKAKLASFAIGERQFCLGLLGLGIVQSDFYEISELTDETLLQVGDMKFEELLENMENPSPSQLEVK